MRHEAALLHELPQVAADRDPQAIALCDDALTLRYDELASEISRFASALAALDVGAHARVAI